MYMFLYQQCLPFVKNAMGDPQLMQISSTPLKFQEFMSGNKDSAYLGSSHSYNRAAVSKLFTTGDQTSNSFGFLVKSKPA